MKAPQAAARHADAELTVSTKAEPKAPERAARDEKNAALMASAQRMREANTAAAETAETPEPPPPREDVESIEVELTDKRRVVLGPPVGVSLTMRIAMSIPEALNNPVVDKLARLCMSIRSVAEKDGAPLAPKPISNMLDLRRMADTIGDVGMDELNFWYDRHWGNVRISDLQLLKKNLRG
jgi:hypothetical protein